MLTFNIISEEKDSLVLATANTEDLPKWVESFHIAFKDITEEHRAAVRSMDTQLKQVDRSSNQPDLLSFGRTTLNKAKVGKSGLSSVAMRKVYFTNTGCIPKESYGLFKHPRYKRA